MWHLAQKHDPEHKLWPKVRAARSCSKAAPAPIVTCVRPFVLTKQLMALENRAGLQGAG